MWRVRRQFTTAPTFWQADAEVVTGTLMVANAAGQNSIPIGVRSAFLIGRWLAILEPGRHAREGPETAKKK